MSWSSQRIENGYVDLDSGNGPRYNERQSDPDPRIALTYGCSSQVYFRGIVKAESAEEAVAILKKCKNWVYGSKYGGKSYVNQVEKWYTEVFEHGIIVCEADSVEDFLMDSDYLCAKRCPTCVYDGEGNPCPACVASHDKHLMESECQ